MDGSSAGDEFNNLQTWPRAQLSHRAMNDLNQWIQVENTIHHAKEYVKGLDGEELEGSATRQTFSADAPVAKELIENLCEMLERLRDAKSMPLGESFHTGRPRRQTTDGLPIRPPEMGTIREEPHFESMIICEASPPPTDSNQTTLVARSAMFKETPAPLQGLSQGSSEQTASNPPAAFAEEGAATAAVDPVDDFSTDPLLLRAIPHITVVLSAVLWLVAGAWIFQVGLSFAFSKPES